MGALILQEYDFKIVHWPRLEHANADVCSRHPLPTTVNNGARRDHDAGAARVQADVASNAAAQHGGPPYIWADHLCMQRPVSRDMPGTASRSERDRMNK